MKKQIALLAIIIAASGFTAFGQDYTTFSAGTAGGKIWDLTGANGGTVLGQGGLGASGDFDFTFLWAPVATSDGLSALGTQFGQGLGSAVDQVATNGVSSTGVGISEISTMLGAGWNIATVFGGSTIAETTSGASGKLTAYPSNPFEIAGVSVASGTSIEEVIIAWNASAAITLANGVNTFASVTDLGWSNPMDVAVGTSAGDVEAGNNESGSMNQFGIGVASVPEPATIALAGLGGLSMLFLRRRKA
jgi:hypothetical protein